MDLKSRAVVAKNAPKIVEYGRRAHANQAMGQVDLFAEADALPPLELEDADPWTVMEGLEAERKVVGFYLSGHPLDPWDLLLYVAEWLNEIKKQNDIKYGSHLLNRRHEGAKPNVRKFGKTRALYRVPDERDHQGEDL
jgi:DNA polymerase III subunit alpha